MSKVIRFEPIIPPSESARLARCVLQPIIEFMDSVEGQKAYEEWLKKMKNSNDK